MTNIVPERDRVAPNTQTKCVIEGIPAKDGLYPIKISATNKNNNGYNTVEQTINLVVTTP